MDIRERILALNIAPRIDSELDPNRLQLSFMTDGADPQTVWGYCVDPAMLASWSLIVPDRPLTEVGEAFSRDTADAEPVPVDVVSLDPGKSVTHRWGDDLLIWTIVGDRLDLTVQLQDAATAADVAARWQICFAVLAANLAGEEQPRIPAAQAEEYGLAELRERIAESLG